MATSTLLTQGQVCELLSMSRSTVYLIRRHDPKFPVPLTVGKSARWDESEIMDWLENQKEARPKKF